MGTNSNSSTRSVRGEFGHELKRNADLVIEGPKPWLTILIAAGKNFYNNQGTTRAAALTYTGLLSVIPFTILLSFLAWHLDTLSLLFGWIGKWNTHFSLDLPLDRIIPAFRRANHIRPNTLGIVGVGSLLVTFWLAFSNLELNLNSLWNITEKRPFLKTVITYFPFLGIIVIALSVLTFFLKNAHHVSALFLDPATTAPLIDIPLADLLNLSLVGIVSIALLWGMLFLVYWSLPHIRVRISAAIWAASFTTVVLAIFIVGAAKLQAFLFVRYSIIYGSLAILPVLLLLSYAIWCVILYGNSLCAQLQKWMNNGT